MLFSFLPPYETCSTTLVISNIKWVTNYDLSHDEHNNCCQYHFYHSHKILLNGERRHHYVYSAIINSAKRTGNSQGNSGMIVNTASSPNSHQVYIDNNFMAGQTAITQHAETRAADDMVHTLTSRWSVVHCGPADYLHELLFITLLKACTIHCSV